MTGRSERGPRDGALDALRGMAVFGMVIVNLQGAGAHAFPVLVHAAWDGLTFADLVFPLFLLASGLALPLALDGRDPPAALGRLARRALLLFLIGLALGIVIGGIVRGFDPAQIRVAGVLQRIAIVWFIAALLCRASRGWTVPALAVLGLLCLHAILLQIPAPGEAAASLLPGQGMSAWLDRALLPGRLFRETWDPEGALSTLSAIATGLIGVAVQRATVQARRPVLVTAGAAVLCANLAFVALGAGASNKALWTPSFALATAAIGLALLAALRAVWPAIGATAPARLTSALGRDALTLYVVHTLLTAILVIPLGGVRLWVRSFDMLAGLGLPLAWASLLYALIAGALSIAITLLLVRRGWQLRV